MGVSVIICCHNSAERLPQTLAHIAAQEVTNGRPWEVIVVDNGSTDDTGQVAQALWPPDPPAPLRVVHEHLPGLTHARHRGLIEAKYAVVCLVDDDNWLSPDWVQVTAEIMLEHPNVGACGGFGEAVCEVSAPAWFEQIQLAYAVGPQGERPGDVTETRGALWGAGLAIRKSAWHDLVSSGFQSLLLDRRGTTLGGHGDTELCFALRLAGWRLWYEPRLRFRHFIPANRLSWDYLRRKQRGGGEAAVGLDPYYFVMKPNRRGLLLIVRHLRQTWQWQALAELARLVGKPRKLLWLFLRPEEGDQDILAIEQRIGRFLGLLQNRKVYSANFRSVRDAVWRRNSRPTNVAV